MVLAGVTSPAFGQQQARAEQGRPNIVLFVADDLGANDIGPYGNKVVRTPNLDKLAKQSLQFSCAFASSPTCAPSRASIYTGQMPFRHGAHANHTGVREGVRTLPVYMQPLGYRVALAGKLSIGPMSAYPFELIHHSNVPEPGHEKQGVLWTDLNMEPVDRWLGEASGRKDPFVLFVNDHSPHVIWPENPAYDPAKLDVPLKHIDTDDTRKSRARYYTDISKMDGNVGKLLESLEKYGLSDNTIVIFTCDQGPQWAFGKWNLYDYGIRVPLLIRWPGVIQGGKKTDALVSLADLLPTAVEAAGGTAPNEPQEIDGRSLIALLKGKVKQHRDEVFASHTGDGKINQAPMRMIRTSRYKYILNLAPEIPYTTHIDLAKDHDGGRQYWPSWVVRSFETEQAAWVMWRYHNRPAEELYDVQADPDETCNLAADPQYGALIETFRTQMAAWRQQQGDHEKGVYQESLQNAKKPEIPYIF